MRDDPREHQFRQHRSCRALVVTEDPRLRKYVAEALSRANYPVEGCGSGRLEILEHCGAKRPSFLVMDLPPDSLTGTEVIRELRARGASIPVILLSAGPCEEAVDPGVEVLPKPFTLETLELAIDRAFARVSLEQFAAEEQEEPARRSE